MRLRTFWPRLALPMSQSRQHPSSFWRFSLELNTRIRPLGLSPLEHHWYQCSSPGGFLAHSFKRQEQTLLVRFRSGHFKTMKFFEGFKSFEMCTNCSSEPASPAHILECLGLTKQDLADDPLLVLNFFESLRSHEPGLALLANGGIQPHNALASEGRSSLVVKVMDSSSSSQELLKTRRLLQGVPDTAQQNVWFRHDGSPAHFSNSVRHHLHPAYPGGWKRLSSYLASMLPEPEFHGFPLLLSTEIAHVCNTRG
ncbi:uncharacterized protein TNCV_2466641 [Trichonephila clavipes]|nr:uncharacterized protein TNCV_2466641 [Trichonephila clavipes]